MGSFDLFHNPINRAIRGKGAAASRVLRWSFWLPVRSVRGVVL